MDYLRHISLLYQINFSIKEAQLSRYQILENQFLNQKIGTIFHLKEFFIHNSSDSGKYFQWVDDGKVMASIFFTEDAGVFSSPGKGTFSGYVIDDELDMESLEVFHLAVMERLNELGARRIEISLAPLIHDVNFLSSQFYLLRKDSFDILSQDLNYSLEISNRKFDELVTYANLKRLRKCERSSFESIKLPISELAKVYKTIELNRRAKGYPITMSLSQIESLSKAFPDDILLWGIPHENQLIAAALCLNISQEVLYVFYWGDVPGYSSYSPVVSIAKSIYKYCQENNFKILDLGTSTLNLQPNYGLINFKEGLGCKASLKLKLCKNLECENVQ